MFFRFILMFCCVCAIYGQTDKKQPIPIKKVSLTDLKVGQVVEKRIHGNETHSYGFQLAAGEFANIEVRQKNLSLAVSLFDEAGRLIRKMEGANGRLWRESISVLADRETFFRVEVKAHHYNEITETYTITLLEKRPAAAADNKRISAESHLSAGIDYFYQGEKMLSQSASELERSVRIWRELNQPFGEAEALFNLGFSYKQLKEVEYAIATFEETVKLFRKLNDRTGEGKSLQLLGNCYHDAGDYKKAVASLEQAGSIFEETGHRVFFAETLYILGDNYNHLKRFDKSQQNLVFSMTLQREIGDLSGEAFVLKELGDLYHVNQLFQKAVDFYAQAFVISRQIKAVNLEKNLLETIEHILREDLKRTQTSQAYLFETITALGKSFRNVGKSEKARVFFQEALSISLRLKDRQSEGRTLISLGIVFEDLEQLHKARDYYTEALNLSREIVYKRLEIDSMNSLANLYKDLGQTARAEEHALQALQISREVKDGSGESVALNNLGNIYDDFRQRQKALEYYQKALEISRAIGDQAGESTTLNNIGNVYRRLGQFEKALGFYEQSLRIERKTEDRHLEGTIVNNFGIIYGDLGQFDKAGEFYEQSLRICREIGDKGTEAIVLSNLMLMYRFNFNEPTLAAWYGKQAVNAYQQIRISVKHFDLEAQQSYLKKVEGTYRNLADLLIDEGRFSEAQAVLDLLKGEEFKIVIRRGGGDNSDTVPYNKTESNVIEKVERLASLENERRELLRIKNETGSLNKEQSQRLEKVLLEIEEANRAFRLALVSLEKGRKGATSRIAEIESEKNLQRALRQLSKETGSGVIALYTVLGLEEKPGSENDPSPERSKFGWVMLVTPTSRKAYPIDVKNLEQNVFAFRKALSSDIYDPRPLAEKLYNAIFRQTSARQKITLESDLQTLLSDYSEKTLMWSLDGILRYIPMAALHDGHHYLVQNYRHVVFTKESLLTLTEEDVSHWNALGLGVSDGRAGFDALPGVERELKQIVRMPPETAGIMDGLIYLNDGFGKTATLQLWREGIYPVVHIASHYSFNPADNSASFLLVGDGKLTFAEMQDKDNLFGSTDLLTLSACDTAMGSGNGKEAEGFAYLAQSLGAKSVIASLWDIPDKETPELMIRFYKLRAGAPNMTKGEAFQRAQLSLLGDETGRTIGEPDAGRGVGVMRTGDQKIELPLYGKDPQRPFAHPHYWSSFILIGNWK